MKSCIGCNKELALSEFSFKNKTKGILQSRCKTCYNEYNRSYYRAGEYTKQRDRVKNNNKLLRQRFRAWKEHQQCCVCGESAVECLDFHHTDPSSKEGNLARAVDFGSWDRVMEEVAKCVIVCANCHRKIHSGRIQSPVSSVD